MMSRRGRLSTVAGAAGAAAPCLARTTLRSRLASTKGGHREVMGKGDQPQPGKPHRAHAEGLQRGRHKEDFAQAKSGPPGPVTQWERSSAPPAESGRAPCGTTAVQAEPLCWPTAQKRGVRSAGCPPVGPAVQGLRVVGAVLRVAMGVQPGEVACRPSDHRAAVPPF